MRALRLAAFAAATLCAFPAAADELPGGMIILKADQVGEIFCLSRIGNDEAVIAGILTDDLRDAIATASARNAAAEAAAPGDKPPLGDGIPWQAWPDYASSCDVGLVSLSSTDARVEISYSFEGQPEAGFVDSLLLKRVNVDAYGTTYWRIDNVAYATGGDLRSALVDAFAAE